MSVHISARIWDTKFSDPSRKLVALAIADAANKEGGAWPSMKTLATMCDLSEDSVRRHIRRLEDMGLLERENRFTNGRQTSNVYQFKEVCADAEPPLHPCNPPPCVDATLPLAPVQPSCIEPSEEPPKELGGVLIPANLNTPEFLEAWDEWTRYRKQAKFKKLTEIGTRQKFKELSEWGPQRAVSAIHKSIGNSWQGIFEGYQNSPLLLSEEMPALDDTQKWFAALFRRPESQQWSMEERQCYDQIPDPTPEEMQKVETHIHWTRRYKPDEFLHRSLKTTLERWTEVLDAARRFKIPSPF